MTWLSNQNGSGWLDYNDTWEATFSTTATERTSGNHTYPYAYTAELRGLRPWGVYEATLGVGAFAGCLEYLNDTHVLFQTLTQATLFEYDYPYDSVTRQGGGAAVMWQEPAGFGSISRFVNGNLSYFPVANTSDLVIVPVSSPWLVEDDGPLGTTFGINVTGLSTNVVYNVSLELNYTVRPPSGRGTWLPLWVGSKPFTFWYEKDTSGDGLTDWEKLRGWEVTGQYASGAGFTQWVAANPSVYATNGLVGDYEEKLYGLNPNTVDSAGSHMLDTWNLTFNLKPGGGTAPALSNFQDWYENGTYNPFASTVQYSPGHYESGRPIAQNITNISASLAGGITSGDGAPWAAEALWSYPALQKFVNLSGVANASWLRAIRGSWDGIPTLAVEGKLSWGANPLAGSTPNDGVPDGERANPLSDLDLQISSVYANESGLASGTGYAVKIIYTYWNPKFGNDSVSNYSSPAIVGQSPGSVSNYVVAIPVTEDAQSQKIELEVVANESSGLTALPINGSQRAINVTYDLVRGGVTTVSVSGSSASLSGKLQVVSRGGKAPTWLWVPTDNSTVNGLPLGLERYTGEQSFELVVVNASGSVSSDSIPLPWGGTASALTLSAGLNDFLVSREQFLNSPLGQAILLGKNTSYNASQGAPPLVGSAEQGLISNFNGVNWMMDLGAYWQNRSIATGPGNITGSTEEGTPSGSTLALQAMAATSAIANNTGGVPSIPGLYNSSDPAPPSLQSVLTLNITSTATLDLLLAGLFDNTTGGSNAVNGTFQSVTNQVGFLGLTGPVVNAIPNAALTGDGLYGAPGSQFPRTQSSGFWGNFWNAATSFVTNPLGTVLSLVGTVWTATTAAFTYLNHLAHEAAAIGGQFLARAASTLVSIGKTILSGLSTLLSFLTTLIRELINQALGPFYELRSTFSSGLDAAVDPSGPQAVWSALSGSMFQLGFVVAIALQIAIGVLTAVTFGATFLINIIIGLILTFGVTALLYLMPQATSPSSQMVDSCQTFASGYTNEGPQANNWTSWANAFSYWETGTSDIYAFTQLKSAWADTKITDFEFGLQEASFAFSLLATALDFYAKDVGGNVGKAATDSAMILDVLSVVLEIPSLAIPSPTKTLDYTILGLDASTAAIAIAEWSAGY